MREDSETAPLAYPIYLTADQQRLILDQTGEHVSAILYESGAREVRCYFGGIPLRVPRGVFVPVATTGHLLHAAIQAASAFARPTIVDVGTGCGALALAIANALPRSVVVATDVSAVALRAARANRVRLRLRNVRFACGSLLTPLPRRLNGTVAIVVANLPHVPPQLADTVERVFPQGTAIGPGKDGLDVVRMLADSARKVLMPGGSLALQLAGFQWPGFADELIALGYAHPEFQPRADNGAVAGRSTWLG